MRGTDLMRGDKPLREMTARHLMERTFIFFKRETCSDAILSAIVNGNFGSVPIVDNKMQLIGIVSEYDLLNAILSGLNLKDLPAAEVMKHPHAVSVDAPAMEIARFVQQNHLIHVPVIDPEGRVVGMVARRDLLAGYLEELIGPGEGFF